MVSHFGTRTQPSQRGPGQATAPATGCAPPPGGAGAGLARYLRVVGALVRGPQGVAIIVAVFVGAGALGGRAGLALAGTYLVFLGTYCVLNFWHCRETHCMVTGPGWTVAGLLGWAGAVVPGGALAWYTVNVASLATIGMLVAGYGLEWAVAATTGRRRLG
jgi:hypothetical protein